MKSSTAPLKWYAIIIAFLICTILASLFISCNKDNSGINDSPEYHIRQSEMLTIPSAIALPIKGTRVATYYAKGVQKYKAQLVAGSSPATYEWVLTGPAADLYDYNGYKVGIHYTGPSWRLTTGYDSIVAQPFSPARLAPSPDLNSIDWLQLGPKSGTVPTGIFADVAFIQRIATTGGKKPAVAPVSEIQTVEVPYTAVYRFTKR